MRSKDFGIIKEAYTSISKEDALKMFDKTCLIRNFELNTAEVYKTNRIEMPVYLCTGQESIPAALATALSDKKEKIFAQHRGHGFYIAFGGNLNELIDELLHRPTGCARGMGGSASIHSPEIGMYGHDGFIGTPAPVSVGYAIGMCHGKKTDTQILTIIADGAIEEGYVMESIGEAATKNLPIFFICQDNNLSVLTEVKVRRKWESVDLAKSLGIENSVDITDDPWLIMYYVNKFKEKLPAFMNIHTARAVWHMGGGCDGPPDWDRFELTKNKMKEIGLKKEAEEIEQSRNDYIKLLWTESLKRK